jgi:hypothetical protein
MGDDRTDVSLKEYLESKLKLSERMASERWEAHDEVHKLLKEAVDAAVATLNARLETMNEFRAQIAQERGSYITRDIYELRHEELKTKVNTFEQYRANMDGRLWMLGAGLTAVVVLINMVFHFWPK